LTLLQPIKERKPNTASNTQFCLWFMLLYLLHRKSTS